MIRRSSAKGGHVCEVQQVHVSLPEVRLHSSGSAASAILSLHSLQFTTFTEKGIEKLCSHLKVQ